ncbi:MAG: hypothetical protein WCF44_01820 [Candidatus Methylophosphatis roskildensis]
MATSTQGDGGRDPAGGASSGTSGSATGSSGLQDTAQAVKDRAGAALDDAKETARSRLNEQKDVAAGGIDDVAGALRDVAKRREDGGGHDPLANLTGSAADGLERLSSTLRNKDVGTMLRDVESFARQQPLAFFGLALAGGFLAVRFLKASEPGSGARSSQLGSNTYQEDPWTTR